MHSKETITHKGIVTATNPLKVEIVTEGACSGCHAKGYCSLSAKKRKEITRFQGTEGWTPVLGEEVVISMHTRLGFKALWYGMGIPALLLGLSVTCFSILKMKEWVVGVFALLCIGIYYFVLYLLKYRIQNDFYFTVHRPNP
ncbi:MAG: SoxR reducing system RseC family protein [Bacteroidales bacterium]|jgi:sigma-E factor negative regulatory protein RseC|nr:SoxR reducing system RseC family protein [Bacteroidales bacterium]HHV40652.1 SoxR reducing system RseC family protein [Bacteroidales bacterium]